MSDPKPRLSLRPAGSHRGAVDGGWWPRETTAEELLAMVEAVRPSFQAVVRVAGNLGTWAGTPRRIGSGDASLRVDLFRTGETGTVRLVGADGSLLDLLLITPDTDEATADAELAAASDAEDLRPVAELLGAAPASR
jgi:hypothetical protein